MKSQLSLLVVVFLITSCGAVAQDIVNMTEENRVIFAVITDPHIGSGEVDNTNKMFHYNQDVLHWAIQQINSRSDVDFVLVLGDLTKDSEPINHVRVKDMLDELSAPYYVIPGNHDVDKAYIQNEKGIEEFVDIYNGHGYADNKSYYSLDPVPGVHLIALDSASDTRLADTWAGGLSDEQLSWLEKDLSQAENKTVIVVAHHALINHTGKNMSEWYIDNRDDVKEMLNRYGVQIFFSGHLHITDIAEEGGIYDISCPATSTYPLAYRMAELVGDELQIDTFWYPDEKVRGIAEAEFSFNGWEGTIEEMAGEFSDRFAVLKLDKNLPQIEFMVPA